MNDASDVQLRAVTAFFGISSLVTVTVIFGATSFWRIRRQTRNQRWTKDTPLTKHPVLFLWLFAARTILAPVSEAILLAIMWRKIPSADSQDSESPFGIWARSVLVAMIVSSIFTEVTSLQLPILHENADIVQQFVFGGFAPALSSYPIYWICFVPISVAGVASLAVGQFYSNVSQPRAVTIAGCAVHRLSMVTQWYLVWAKASRKLNIDITLGGHVVALLAVPFAFLDSTGSLLNFLLVRSPGHSSY